MNQVILVGKIENDVILEENGDKFSVVKLAVNRPFKNIDGIYEKDIIECRLLENIAINTAGLIKKGDVIGVKGRLQNNNNEIEVIAEKVTFLSKNKEKKVEN